MPTGKSVVIRTAAFGGGFAVVSTLLLGVFLWWAHRPEKPKPWNLSAMKASYDHTDVTQEKYFEFRYIIKNETDSDYTLDDSTSLHVEAKTDDGALHSCKDCVTLQTPVFIPAHESASVEIVLKYHYPDAKPNLTDDERKAQRKAQETYLKNEMPRLDGFSLHDERTRYEIQFPADWKKS